MQKKERKRIKQSAIAGFSVLALLAGSMGACADEITFDDGSDTGSGIGSGIDAGIDAGTDDRDFDSPFLIEDTGEDVQYNAGVPMDTLQDAMASGDQKTLDKIASLGALTGKNSATASEGSGVGGGGAYRGSPEDEEDEEYYDLHLDEGDADEVETTQTDPINESPGPLIAASADRVQEHLDAMTQVESPTGSEGEMAVASYIETKMAEMGYTVQEQAFHEGVLNEDGVDAPGINVLAERGANSQTNRKKDIFLVVTHYDSKRAPEEGDPFANDKSGAAALIESARILSEVVTDTDVCFLFLSGEEDGGYGAQSFLDALSEENRARITGVLSVDRVGYDSKTPNVLKTMTGEGNYVGDLVQQLGIANDAYLQTHREETPEEDYGTWVGVGESSDGYIDERTAQQIAAAQAGEDIAGDHAIDIDTGEYLQAQEEASTEETFELDEAETETESEPVPMPSAWSYLKDSSPTMASFASQPFPTVKISQYIPQLDAASYAETISLGLADPAPGEGEAAAAPEQVPGAEASPEVSQETNADGSVAGSLQLEDSNLTGAADDAAEGLPGMEADDAAAGLPGMEADDAAAGLPGMEADDAAAGLPGMEADDAASGLPGMEPADSAADPTGMDDLEDSGGMDYTEIPVVNASLVADTTNVIAAALAQIMDPAT